MINPALFVGLGSTGLRILRKLQDLVLEEYGVRSLPIFRYVAILMEENSDQVLDVKRDSTSQIVLLHPIVPSTNAVRLAIAKGERKYYDWLDTSVLDIEGGMFSDGAGLIRTAGRLSLWENWQSLAADRVKPGCTAALQMAHNQITANPNRTLTTNVLTEIYQNWQKPIPPLGIQIGDKPNVYLVGSLCGGTCGGMFIDIAYYLKHLFGLWQRDVGGVIAKVIGVFTIYDSHDLQAATSETGKNHAGNCWASLWEYDYYCHPKSQYRIVFPDGSSIDTAERPLDYLYILSCSGNGTNLRNQKGEADEESLANMAAMILFSETVEGTLGEKERIRIDRRSKPRALTPNKNQHMACIATCGAATFRYPKYRVIEGAAARYASELCNTLLGEELREDEKAVLAKEASGVWHTVRGACADTLIHTPAGLLTDVVAIWFQKHKEEHQARAPGEIVALVRKQLEKFSEGKDYDKEICARKEELKDELVRKIMAEVQSKLNEARNLKRVLQFTSNLDRVIEAAAAPGKYPAPDLTKAAADISVDLWTKALGLGGAVLQEKKADYLTEKKQEFVSQMEKIRDFRFKEVLSDVRAEIGIGVPPPADWISGGKRSIKQELEILEDTLRKVISRLEGIGDSMERETARTQDVVIITRGTDVKEDVKNLQAAVRMAGNTEEILRRAQTEKVGDQDVVKPFAEWLGWRWATTQEEFVSFEAPEVRERRVGASLLNSVRLETLNHWERLVLARELHRRARSLGVNVCDFVKHFLPHLQLKGELAGVSIGGQPLEFLAGRDSDPNAQHMKAFCDLVQQNCSNPPTFSDRSFKHMEELEAVLFLYKEEGLIYMDENLSTSSLFEQKYSEYERHLRTSKKTSFRTLHTHRMGRSFFDIWVLLRREEARNWMQIALEIFSTRDESGNWSDSEVFKVEGKTPVLRITLPDGSPDVIIAGDKGVERLAQNKNSFDHFRDLVAGKAVQTGKDNFIRRLNQLCDWVEKDALRRGLDPPTSIGLANAKRDEYLSEANPERLIDLCFPDGQERGN